MLALTRKLSESIVLDTPAGRATIKVVQIRKGQITLAIDAPPAVRVLREEIAPAPTSSPIRRWNWCGGGMNESPTGEFVRVDDMRYNGGYTSAEAQLRERVAQLDRALNVARPYLAAPTVLGDSPSYREAVRLVEEALK